MIVCRAIITQMMLSIIITHIMCVPAVWGLALGSYVLFFSISKLFDLLNFVLRATRPT